ncbi:hypothetical protein TNCV_2477841 [Trichonephila clavipes]|nr:hypothetical protein TNCV_2477841 [Trichonephila clavipes]
MSVFGNLEPPTEKFTKSGGKVFRYSIGLQILQIRAVNASDRSKCVEVEVLCSRNKSSAAVKLTAEGVMVVISLHRKSDGREGVLPTKPRPRGCVVGRSRDATPNDSPSLP